MKTLEIGAGNWTEVPGEGSTDAALAVALVQPSYSGLANDPQFNELFLFGKGIKYPGEYVNSRALEGQNQGWTGWSALPAGGTTNVAMAANYSAANATDFGVPHGPALRLLAKGGADNVIYVSVCTFGEFSARQWAGWKPIPAAFKTLQPVAVSSVKNGDWFVVAQSANDRTLWMNKNPTGNAAAWTQIPGGATTNHAPAIVASDTTVYPDATLFVFHTGDNSRIYYNILTPSQNNWSGWNEVPGDGTTDVAVAATALENWIVIAAKGINDLHFYYNVYDIPRGQWYGWTLLPGGAQTNAPPTIVAAPMYSNHLLFFGKGINVQRVYVNYSTFVIGGS